MDLKCYELAYYRGKVSKQVNKLTQARYFLDAGRRSSSTQDRTRYSYMLPHFATL
ncbi:hypothetical protein HanRHA438_Chr08g0331401 [Helianthus annuus]|nr:hypothetical protein HanRHA438_Chr08g0331401 [Helianthus annuus]